MINKASNYIESKKIILNYKYIIIDEFQDISIGRYKLIKAIKTNKPSCKLFCVGDDWQSIYRFTGSDISLFKNYEDYFGFTIKSKIETTYRFHNPLIKLSSEFILKNKNQNEKNLKSISSNKKTEYEVIYSEDDDNTFSVKRIFEQIIENDSSANLRSGFTWLHSFFSASCRKK
jgi:DNA helicase-4